MYVRARREHRADTGRALRARVPRARREPRAHGARRWRAARRARAPDGRQSTRTAPDMCAVGDRGPAWTGCTAGRV
eukprot:1907120-Pleurochrysis_carterae.AAC.1